MEGVKPGDVVTDRLHMRLRLARRHQESAIAVYGRVQEFRPKPGADPAKVVRPGGCYRAGRTD
jgi:hypothetical protein